MERRRRRKVTARENRHRAIGYLRVSTTEQKDSGLGLAAQEERIRAYATAQGLELTRIIRDEGVSGSVPFGERPGGAELAAALVSGEVGAVIAHKLDRMFRNAADCLVQTEAWNKAGVALHLLDLGGQSINTSAAMGRMFLTMTAGFAELERNLIRERTAGALAEKRKRREKHGPAQVYGYRVAEDGVHLVEDVDEQKAIRRIHALMEKGLSLRAIGTALEAKGINPRTGGRWHATTIARVLDRPTVAAAA